MTSIGIVVYPGFTALDAVGPYEVLARVPGARVTWIAEQRGTVRADRGLEISADATFDDAPQIDLLLVPGGPGQLQQMDGALVSFLRERATRAEVVASVCTGSLLLAAAGLLDGKHATTHWLARDALERLGAIFVEQRDVREGNVFTAAGVSAGIDLALTLAAMLSNDEVAQAIQLGIEYAPEPPFASGSPSEAPAAIVAGLRERARDFL